MNKREKDVLIALSSCQYIGQRDLAKRCSCSLGAVNASLQALSKEGYITPEMKLTKKATELLSAYSPKRAIILAAGFGIHQPPSYIQRPKPLLKVRGERLIERTISQLKDVGINEIHIVVGFAKEQFEYLIDKYSVDLIVNSQYAEKNNLHSLALAKDYLENSYIVPADIWCKKNPFSQKELYSWYMVSDTQTAESSLRVNRYEELAPIPHSSMGNYQIGISYIAKDEAAAIRQRLCEMDSDRRYQGSFWEETLYSGSKFILSAKLCSSNDAMEINRFEDIQELNSDTAEVALLCASNILGTNPQAVQHLTLLKRGQTNSSYRFDFGGKQYVIRIPTEKVDRLINHSREAEICRLLEGKGIAENLVFHSGQDGLKLSEYIKDCHPCNPQSKKDLEKSMALLRRFHNLNLKSEHATDLFEAIEYYESLWEEEFSLYPDYPSVKKDIFSLKPFIEKTATQKCLTHFDAVPENFLISDSDNSAYLIDWEYAAMQDPHLDIAMFCLQALYDQKEIDSLIDIYFEGRCEKKTRIKIYCYIAIGGLLWSNWCESEIRHGAEFGAYSIKQYRYAKEYYKIAKKEMENFKEDL